MISQPHYLEVANLRSRLRALETKHGGTYCAEYQGQIHVRVYRRVVIVVDLVEGTARVNEISNKHEAARVNEVLDILDCRARIAEAGYADIPPISADSETIVAPRVYFWYQSATARPARAWNLVPRTAYTFAELASPYAVAYAQGE